MRSNDDVLESNDSGMKSINANPIAGSHEWKGQPFIDLIGNHNYIRLSVFQMPGKYVLTHSSHEASDAGLCLGPKLVGAPEKDEKPI